MKVRAIRITPTSEDQRDELEAYAQVKGLKDASHLCLFAAENYIARNGLTEAQKAKAEKIIKDRQTDRAALARGAV